MTTGIVGAFGFAQSIPDKDYCLPFWKWALNKILPNSLDFQCPVYDSLLGVATQTGNFTTSFNNFQDNDIINAGDWNAIEYAIGTTTPPTGGFASSTATSTLFYLVKNTSSSDPGHKHTFSGSINGTSSVSQGGTGSGSFNKGLVMASGTDAFSSLQTNGNGSIPIASGTTWVANTLTAGTNITLTNAVGSVTITAGSNTIFGDGSDGVTTIAATTTLSSDKYYNSLTVNSGITLYTGGYKIFDKGTLTNNGIIANDGGNGGNASAGTAGAACSATASSTTAGYMGLPSAGATGVGPTNLAGVASAAGGNLNPGFGVNGAVGGTSGNGGGSGTTAGAAGTATQSTNLSFELKNFGVDGVTSTALLANTTTTLRQLGMFWMNASSSSFIGGSAGSSGGAAGGSGTTGTSGAGGGGGCPGGVISIVANTLANNGTIQTKGGIGGNGGNAGTTTGAFGGGGTGAGGSGGVIVLGFSTSTAIGTIDVSGGLAGQTAGTGGTGGGTAGSLGANGNTGNVYRIIIQ